MFAVYVAVVCQVIWEKTLKDFQKEKKRKEIPILLNKIKAKIISMVCL